MTMTNGWIIPFRGRNHSGTHDYNMLWKHDKIYVMDNHALSLWCWLQEVSFSSKYNIMHIDRHYDTLSTDGIDTISLMDSTLVTKTPVEFMEMTYNMQNCSTHKVMRWDNYLAIWFEKYKALIDRNYFAVHGGVSSGHGPTTFRVNDNIRMGEIPENIEHWLTSNRSDSIINIDMDYFFYEHDGDIFRLVDGNYIRDLFEEIKKVYKKTDSVITVCFSPEYCGGWKPAEDVMEIFNDVFQIKFQLP